MFFAFPRIIALAILLFAASFTWAGEAITGPAQIVDGDTITIKGHRIRLDGSFGQLEHCNAACIDFI